MFWIDIERDVVVAEGVDAATYLHSQLSQDIAGLAVGAATWSLLLAPDGKVESLIRVLRQRPQRFLLDVDAGHGAAVLARLQRYRIRVAVELQLTVGRVRCVRPEPGDGAISVDALSAESSSSWVTAWGGGIDAVSIEDDELPPLPEAVSFARPGVPDDLERARIEACWPLLGAEIVAGATIPASTGVVDVAVSFTKGCYPGQELVERMDSRGAAPPRHLEVHDVGTDAVAGDIISVDGVEIGTATSVLDGRAIVTVRRVRPG